MEQEQAILEYISSRCAETAESGERRGVSAAEVASQFGMWQDEASRLLSGMTKAGTLEAAGRRPILYALAVRQEETGPEPEKEAAAAPFSSMIGYNGSLEYQIQVASAAVSYPPNGIHTLIIGKTGVGKSMLAAEMARYLEQERGCPQPFVTFNCAEYADNPQLLLAQLFGYVRGAFTGAEKNKRGLVEEADGGILFLDEIHRLPPTGQEMLFTLIDNGSYRRLGDSETRSASLMIIGATTEDPSAFLLSTFKRRIPVVIQIPELRERPIHERLDLISRFFYEESCKLGMPVFIAPGALKLLVSFQGRNNIGDLRNEVRVACAQSRWALGQQGTPDARLVINDYHLSRNLSIHYSNTPHIDAFFTAAGLDKGLTITPGVPVTFSPEPAGAQTEADGEYEDAPNDLLSRYLKNAPTLMGAPRRPGAIAYGAISPVVLQGTHEMLEYASKQFRKTYNQDSVYSIAYYLQQLMSYANAERVVFTPGSFDTAAQFSEEKAFVKKMLPLLKSYIGIELTEGEIYLLALLLSRTEQNSVKAEMNLIVCGYGGSASAMASFANQMLNTGFIKAVDIYGSLDQSALQKRLLKAVSAERERSIVMCGIGLSGALRRILEKNSRQQTVILPVLDPMLVLECARMILMANAGPEEIVGELVREYTSVLSSELDAKNTLTAEADEEDPSGEMRDVVITYCITGVGSARMVREILLQDISVSTSIDILPLGIKDDLASLAHRLGKRLKLVIGIINPEIPGVPFISLEQFCCAANPMDLLRSTGISLPGSENASADELADMPIERQLQLIRQNLHYFAPSLDHDLVEKGAKYIIDRIASMYVFRLPDSLVVRIYIHCATMFERIKSEEPISMPLDGYDALEKQRELFEKMRNILNTGGSYLGLTVTDAEVYYLLLTLPDME